jgi:hypothetical protein
MRPRYATSLFLFLLLALAGCGDRNGPRLGSDDMAAAGDFRLTVDEAAELLVPAQGLPNDPEVVRALAEFWVDYTLLALAVNQEGGLESLDLAAVVEPQEKQSLVMQLRNEVIDDDFEIGDDEVDAFYENDRPGEEVRARHILLMYPTDATQAQRDSVRALAEELRDRARAGADFGALAAEYSDDTGTAGSGGDLDYFSRGAMVPPFEEAAFALEPGQVSEVVESQFGLHVIRSEDRRRPELDDVREELRAALRQSRTLEAESIFVADVNASAGIEYTENAWALMREAASQVETGLSGRAANQVLATYDGGRFTAGDFVEFLETQAPALIPQVEPASDEDLQGLLENLVQSEVLVAEARRRGLEADPEETREIVEGVREQYRQVAEAIGIQAIEPAEGETLAEAIDRSVMDLMARVVRGEVDVFPLQQLAIPLREQFGHRISDEGVERAVARVEELRAAATGGESVETPPSDDPMEVPPADAPTDPEVPPGS